jgi:uncharacterized protein with GYD domain
MPTFIMLANYTQQGLSRIKDTTKRAEEVKALASKAGLTMKETYWVLGQHDVVAVFDAPSDEAMTSFALSIAKMGNITTQTLRAFTATEMGRILDKTP